MFTPQELGRSVAYYPLVGVLLGVLLAGLDAILTYILPCNVIAVLVLAAWVILTGALHLDGYLDSCDGLFGGHSPERRLEIMRDERVGAFGLAGGVLLLLLKYTALVALPAEGGLVPNRAVALLLAPTLGRWAMSSVVVAFPYARSEGLGRVVKDRSGRKELALATVFALAIAGLTASWLGWVAVVVAGVLGWGVARFALTRVQVQGGQVSPIEQDQAEQDLLNAQVRFESDQQD